MTSNVHWQTITTQLTAKQLLPRKHCKTTNKCLAWIRLICHMFNLLKYIHVHVAVRTQSTSRNGMHVLQTRVRGEHTCTYVHVYFVRREHVNPKTVVVFSLQLQIFAWQSMETSSVTWFDVWCSAWLNSGQNNRNGKMTTVFFYHVFY